VALGNFDGFAGAYRIQDTVANVLLGTPSTITGAASITVNDSLANLLPQGVTNVMTSFSLAGVNVVVTGVQASLQPRWHNLTRSTVRVLCP
jgi:hypothetical protein